MPNPKELCFRRCSHCDIAWTPANEPVYPKAVLAQPLARVCKACWNRIEVLRKAQPIAEAVTRDLVAAAHQKLEETWHD